MRIRTVQKETTVSASRDKNTARKLPRGSSGGFSGEEKMKQRAKTCLQNGEEWVKPGCREQSASFFPGLIWAPSAPTQVTPAMPAAELQQWRLREGRRVGQDHTVNELSPASLMGCVRISMTTPTRAGPEGSVSPTWCPEPLQDSPDYAKVPCSTHARHENTGRAIFNKFVFLWVFN